MVANQSNTDKVTLTVIQMSNHSPLGWTTIRKTAYFKQLAQLLHSDDSSWSIAFTAGISSSFMSLFPICSQPEQKVQGAAGFASLIIEF